MNREEALRAIQELQKLAKNKTECRLNRSWDKLEWRCKICGESTEVSLDDRDGTDSSRFLQIRNFLLLHQHEENT